MTPQRPEGVCLIWALLVAGWAASQLKRILQVLLICSAFLAAECGSLQKNNLPNPSICLVCGVAILGPLRTRLWAKS